MGPQRERWHCSLLLLPPLTSTITLQPQLPRRRLATATRSTTDEASLAPVAATLTTEASPTPAVSVLAAAIIAASPFLVASVAATIRAVIALLVVAFREVSPPRFASDISLHRHLRTLHAPELLATLGRGATKLSIT